MEKILLPMNKDLTPEQLFLRYAVPCAFVLRQRGDVEDEMVAKLEMAAMGEEVVERDTIEKIFSAAFRRIDKVAKEMGKDRWDTEVIREYFLNRHNQFIAEGDGEYARAPQTLKDLCRVERAKVVSKHGSFYIVNLKDGKTRTVIPPFVHGAEVGDEIIIHYGYGVEGAKDFS